MEVCLQVLYGGYCCFQIQGIGWRRQHVAVKCSGAVIFCLSVSDPLFHNAKAQIIFQTLQIHSQGWLPFHISMKHPRCLKCQRHQPVRPACLTARRQKAGERWC